MCVDEEGGGATLGGEGQLGSAVPVQPQTFTAPLVSTPQAEYGLGSVAPPGGGTSLLPHNLHRQQGHLLADHHRDPQEVLVLGGPPVDALSSL